jgi:glycosyltransferase involved in cell wall biosynthesis
MYTSVTKTKGLDWLLDVFSQLKSKYPTKYKLRIVSRIVSNDEELRKRISITARKIGKKYSWEKICKRFISELKCLQ